MSTRREKTVGRCPTWSLVGPRAKKDERAVGDRLRRVRVIPGQDVNNSINCEILQQSSEVCVPGDIVRLARIPNSTAMRVEHWWGVHVALLESWGSGGHSKRTEEHSSEGLREHHESREMRRLKDADERELRGVIEYVS